MYSPNPAVEPKITLLVEPKPDTPVRSSIEPVFESVTPCAVKVLLPVPDILTNRLVCWTVRLPGLMLKEELLPMRSSTPPVAVMVPVPRRWNTAAVSSTRSVAPPTRVVAAEPVMLPPVAPRSASTPRLTVTVPRNGLAPVKVRVPAPDIVIPPEFAVAPLLMEPLTSVFPAPQKMRAVAAVVPELMDPDRISDPEPVMSFWMFWETFPLNTAPAKVPL